MAKFCTKCGAQMEDDAQFCPACGAKAAEQQQPQGTQQQTYTEPNQQPNQGQQQTWEQPNQNQQTWDQKVNQGAQNFAKATQMNDYTGNFHPNDIGYNKGYSVLSYIGILVLIPFLSQRGKGSPYTRFHAIQGMYLFLCNIALGIVNMLLGLIRVNQSYFGFVEYSYVPWPVRVIQVLISIVSLTYMILGIVFAATGQAKDLPLVGKLRKLGWFK